MSAVSERIKALIEQSGLSYRSLAKKVGVSNVTVRNWAIGHSEPNREGLEALCEIFGVTPAYVMFGSAALTSVFASSGCNTPYLPHKRSSCTLGLFFAPFFLRLFDLC